MDTEVLVVEAGPTGLMLANQLVRRDVRVLIIDRHDNLFSTTLSHADRSLVVIPNRKIAGPVPQHEVRILRE